MSRTPTLAEVLNLAIESKLIDLHTSMPGIVKKYDSATQTVDVQPALKRVVRDIENNELVESLPLITNVPVAFPRANDAFVTFPIAAGDSVLLVFSERSIDRWRDKDEEVDPAILRRHHLADAVAYPGVYASGKALVDAHDTNIVVGFDGGRQIHIEPGDTTIHIGSESAADFVALAAKVKTQLDNIQTAIETHIHPTGVGPSGQAGPGFYTSASVAADKTKAD